MSTPTSTTWLYLEPRPKSFYRQLFIKGTRLRAEAIYGLSVDGTEPMTVEEIAADFGLPLEAVQEAIAYCQSNPREIEQDHRREDVLREVTGMDEPSLRGKPKLLSPQERARILER